MTVPMDRSRLPEGYSSQKAVYTHVSTRWAWCLLADEDLNSRDVCSRNQERVGSFWTSG